MRVLAAAGPRLTPPSTRFTTVVGIPKTIALQYATGRDVVSRKTGKTERMYTLTNGEKAYFDLDVAAAIDSLTLAPGQPFTVCHHGGGAWDVERAVPEQGTGDRGQGPGERVPAPQPPRYWGAEQQPATPPPSRQPAASASVHSTLEPSTKLEHALKTAIRAASNAERFAAELGYQVRFDADMITRQAITLLINMEKGNQ
jgi:hypothetical protein